MQPVELFIEVVSDCEELPAEVRANASRAHGVEETWFDKSYIDFLDTQIRLSPRGREWTAILQRRRDALIPFCGVTLVSGRVRAGQFDTAIKVDPKERMVIFWEQLKRESIS